MTSKNYIPVIALLTLFISSACNQAAKTDESAKADTVAARAEASTMPAYDPELDPVKVEAPFLTLHKDTLGIKLYEVTLKPGDSVGLHTHPDHVLYVAQGGTIKIYPKEGEPQTAELPTGAAMIFPAQSHSGINTGTTTVKLVVADIYRPKN